MPEKEETKPCINCGAEIEIQKECRPFGCPSCRYRYPHGSCD